MNTVVRLPRVLRILVAAAILMPAAYGVVRLAAGGSLAKPTYKEKVQANQGNGYGQPVSVTGTGYQASASVKLRVSRPDGPQDTALAETDSRGNLAFSYSPRSKTGSFVLEVLGEEDFGLAATSFVNGAAIQSVKGNYDPGEAAALVGTGWRPREAVTLIVHEESPTICPDRAYVATADSKGNISSSDAVLEAHEVGVTYAVTATGQSSGLIAEASFTSNGFFVGNIGTATRAVSGNTSLTIPVGPAGVAAGHSILVGFASSTFAGTVRCSDSKNNDYRVDADRINGGTGRVTICSAHNVIPLVNGDTIKVTYPGFSGNSSATANEFQGLAAVDALDVIATGTGNTAFPTSGPAGPTSDPNELLYGAILFSGTNFAKFTPDGSYTRTNPDLAGRPLASQYKVVSSIGTYQANGTLTTANQWAAALAAYRIAPPTCEGTTIEVIPAILGDGTLGMPYPSVTFDESGGEDPCTMTQEGKLPSGMSFDEPTATLGGTPMEEGIFHITVNVVDANGCKAAKAYSFRVSCPTIKVANPSQNLFTVGTAFSETFTQSGGVEPITWSVMGTLPLGITLNSSTGVLSGTPTQTGTFPINVVATDANGCTEIGPSYVLTILCQRIDVINPAVSTGTAGVAFSQTFTALGAIGGKSFTASGMLPVGISLLPSGVLSGTTVQTGSFPIIVTVTDENGCSRTGETYTLTINCQPITVTNPAVNTGTAGVAFSQTFTAVGTLATTTWTETGELPTGLTLDPLTGVLSGTTSQSGTFPITVKAADINGCFGTTNYTLTIAPAGVCPTIIVGPSFLPAGTWDVLYPAVTLTQTGGAGTATFSWSGSMPSGMTLSADGVLSGTPNKYGTYPITVTATDSNGCAGSRDYLLVLACPGPSQVITVLPESLPAVTVGTPYPGTTFLPTGGMGKGYMFAEAGALPAGMIFDALKGDLFGTPTQAGVFPITIAATDANLCPGSRDYLLVVTCSGTAITINQESVPPGTTGVAYPDVTFTASGGTDSYAWVEVGALPPGMTFDTSTGKLSGTPMKPGTFPFTVAATDAKGCAGARNYSLSVTTHCDPITVTKPAVNSGWAGEPFSQAFTQSGGAGTITWSMTEGQLPGLTLDPSSGVLSGILAWQGTFTATVKATDANGCSGTSSYTLTINCQTIAVTNPTTTAGTVGVGFEGWFSADRTPGTVTFGTGSPLPGGLWLSTDGKLAGVPTQAGTFPIVVTATDMYGCAGTGATYTLTIAPSGECSPMAVGPSFLPAGTDGLSYPPVTFTQTGGAGTVAFSVFGNLPTGMNFADGVLSGTPVKIGSFPITVTATDSNGCTGSRDYLLVIACPGSPITVWPDSLPEMTVYMGGAIIFVAEGGNPKGYTFAQAGALPSGMTFDKTGILSGSPKEPGVFPITISATDANFCPGSRDYLLVVRCDNTPISVGPGSLSPGSTGVPYPDVTFTATGGSNSYTFYESGALPPGMTFDAALAKLSGTPTISGTYLFTVFAADANGCAGSRTYSLSITTECNATITVNNPTENTGSVGVAFNQAFTQTGGTGTITWTESGELPTGITFKDGALSGTPSKAGTFPIAVTATDINGCSDTSNYTLTISCQTITVTNPAQTTGTAGAGFDVHFGAQGAQEPMTFSLSELPPGLGLNAPTGNLFGVPTKTGTFPLVMTVTDANGCTGTSNYTLTITCGTITVINPPTVTGTVGVFFGPQFFEQQGGIGFWPELVFTLEGTLPMGMNFSPLGTLVGTPTEAGTFPLVVTVTDANGCTGTGSTYNLVISGGT